MSDLNESGAWWLLFDRGRVTKVEYRLVPCRRLQQIRYSTRKGEKRREAKSLIHIHTYVETDTEGRIAATNIALSPQASGSKHPTCRLVDYSTSYYLPTFSYPSRLSLEFIRFVRGS